MADPWAADGTWPGEAAVARDALTSHKPKADDPWGPGTVTNSDGDTSPVTGSAPKVSTDRFGRRFMTGLPNAPECNCGAPAAKMSATSRAGKAFSAWRCADDAPGGDYTRKCEFSELL